MKYKVFIFSTLLVIFFLFATCGETVPTPPVDGDADTDADSDTEQQCEGGCPSGSRCVDGNCVEGECSATEPCESPLECCGGTCVNVRDDINHCGECDNSCVPSGDACIGSTCSCNGAMPCAESFICCEGEGCIDGQSDRNNCGSCGTECDGECVNGDCSGCIVDEYEEQGGNTCPDAIDIGELTDSLGESVTVEGSVFPAGDADCYMINAIDHGDGDEAGCNTFNFDIQFTLNPDDELALEVYRGSCEARECSSIEVNHYTWNVDFFTGDTTKDFLGECPCDVKASTENIQICSDNSAVFRFCVVRASGDPSGCTNYRIEISNGTETDSTDG